MARTLINMPRSARRGAVIEIRTLIAHPMETGYRPGADGKLLSRDLIRRFSCVFDDGVRKELVFSMELFSAISSNPYIGFHMVATASGKLMFAWEGDNAFTQSESVGLTVT